MPGMSLGISPATGFLASDWVSFVNDGIFPSWKMVVRGYAGIGSTVGNTAVVATLLYRYRVQKLCSGIA